MTIDRDNAARVLLPIVCLVLAGAVHLGGFPLQEMRLVSRVTVSLLATALVFATVFAVLHHADRKAHV